MYPKPMRPEHVFHFSEDPSIRIFRPHVPKTKPDAEPLVWAIDGEHAPLYWFPRDCPRVTCWIGADTSSEAAADFRKLTSARRLHAIEEAWLERMRSTPVYAYRFDSRGFEEWPDADGHWVARRTVEPVEVEPLGNLLARHLEAGLDLRIEPSLWPLHDWVVESGLRFSIVRMRNAQPRP